MAIVKHLHPEASDSISNCQLGIPANNHVTVSFVDAGIPNSLDVTLDPPIKDVSDGYKRILALRNEAWLALGVIAENNPSQPPRPQVRTFVPPPLNPSGFLVALIILQAYTILTPAHSRYAGLANLIRGTVTQLVGAWFLPFSVVILIGAHSIEAIYMYLLCNEHRVPTDAKVKYVLATVCVGFPALQEFKAETSRLRIEAMHKTAKGR
ncbi:hypothetical protein QFC20_004118 [Naganishia adeliensis]|uniref:Uncharacterized protein n=1 Tax=Naganishia adeliensis TaxID=92952 RepID=A0ACC2W379_9TREE|nr:hypothetical protein QFC20_004118 [Naganishia adeliensis]